VERRRAQAILQRIRALATFFAVVTVVWMPIDALLFEPPTAMWLAMARGIGAFALFGLVLASSPALGTIREARQRSVILFTVPAIFYIASLQIFHYADVSASASIVVNAYSFVPFLLAAGIAVFPLSFVECAALLLIALAAQAFALHWHPGETRFITAEALWLQLLLGGAGSFAALSQRRLLAELVTGAVKDPLTGCHRRESGRELLAMHFHLARRRNAPLAVLFLDLDKFKRVNDELGHDAGDQVLSAAASALRAGMRLSDVLVRWGGEEFVMVLPDTRFADAVAIAERARLAGARSVREGLRLTLSIGVAERVHDGIADPEALVALADQRMYRAKQAGRDRCVATGGLENGRVVAA
jgi:diguanylate cyclase (GGDEF)-like protein